MYNKSKGYSPWGSIQNIEKLERGISSVSTSSHGGLRVAPGWAIKNLSDSAIRRSTTYGNYLWFEEDCQWALVVFECKHLWKMFKSEIEKEEMPKIVLATLKQYYPEYLKEINYKEEKKVAV